MPVFATDVSRHVMYSLPNPSESERPFSPLEEPVLPALGRRGGERGTERIAYAVRQGRHAIGQEGHRIEKALCRREFFYGKFLAAGSHG